MAIFRGRSDIDWDFVAMFALEPHTFPNTDMRKPEQIVDLLAAAIQHEGDDALIDYFLDPDVPSVYEWHPTLQDHV